MNTTAGTAAAVLATARTHRAPAARIIAVFAAVVSSLLMTLFAATPAEAATTVGAAGRIGSITLNGPMINGYDVGQRLANGTYFYSKNWNVGGFTVTRSPASYRQRVTGKSTIQKWNGARWVDIQSRTWSGTVAGTGTLRFPGWTYSPTNVPNNRASYRVNFLITWTNTANGQLVALTGVVPNKYSDNRCATTFFTCRTYTDGINF